MGTKTGSEVLAYCGSCKMDLMAMVVAKVGAEIVKVQCKTCRKERSYRAPKGVSEPGAEPAKSVLSRPRSTRATSNSDQTAKSVPVHQEWERLMGESKANRKISYTIKAGLHEGDIVQHSSFGDGVVMKVLHPDKAQVIFKDDVRTLVHSRK